MFATGLSAFSNSRPVHIMLLRNCGSWRVTTEWHLLWKAVSIDRSAFSCLAIDGRWNEPRSQSPLCWKALPAETRWL